MLSGFEAVWLLTGSWCDGIHSRAQWVMTEMDRRSQQETNVFSSELDCWNTENLFSKTLVFDSSLSVIQG